MKEAQEHRLLMQWVAAQHGRYPELRWLVHIPNEGGYVRGLGPATAKLGINQGVPDFWLPAPRRGYHGLWIELKRPAERATPFQRAVPRGRLQPEQVAWRDHLNAQGFYAAVAYGAEAAWTILQTYLELPR